MKMVGKQTDTERLCIFDTILLLYQGTSKNTVWRC